MQWPRRTTGAAGFTRRREMLQGSLAVLAATLAAPAFAIGRQDLGDGELITINDGTLSLPLAFAFPEAPREDLAQLLSESVTGDTLVSDCNVTLLRRGDRLAIFDTGSGPNFVASAGRLLDGLAEAGIDPGEVTDVILTHAHPDHLWGIADDFDDLVFANAAYRIGQAEWDFWSAPDAIDQVPEDRQTFVVGAQNRFAMIAEQVSFVAPGEEVFPGVEAVDTAGHTPGHLSYLVHAGSDAVLVAGDAVSNAVLSFARPHWHAGSDHDPARAAATRQSLLGRLADESTGIIGYHLPHTGIGRVERDAEAFRYVPVSG